MDKNIENIKQKAVAGTIWNFLSNILTKLASMIVQLVLARLLVPEEFGTIAILNVFISISHVLISTGFASAIIQKSDLTETDKSSVFYMGMGISAVLYILILIFAPFVADFYNRADIEPVLRAYAIVIVIGALVSVQNALVRKEMHFKVTMWKGIITVIVQGFVGVPMAFMGYGVWALVVSYIVGQTVSAVYMWIVVKWKPKLLFSWSSVKSMFKFGSNVLLSSLFNTVYTDIRALIIGKVYSSETLAYYDRANLLRAYIFDTTVGAVSTVALPTLSKVNDNLEKVKNGLRRIVRINMFVGTPLRVGTILVAEALILTLLTEKWAECIPFLQIICLTTIFGPATYRTNAYLAMGKSGLALRTEIFNKSVILICIFSTIHISVYMVVFSALIGNVLSFITGLFVNRKYLNYTIKEQFFDILPAMFFSVLMGVPVYFAGLIELAPIVVLIIQGIVGVASYILIAFLFKYETFFYLLKIFKNMIQKKK